jgi:type II secretory pathway component GspD/PulD (secretin)
MKHKTCAHILSLGLFLFTFSIDAMLLDSNFDATQMEKTEDQLLKKRKSVSSTSSEMIEFNFTQKPLKDLINEFASKLNINILYPETETVTATVTFDAAKKITMTEAWDFVLMIIEQAGYTLLLKGTATYILLASSKSYKEPLPLYIGVDFNQLPDTMQRIRYVYYFNNIQVAKQQAELQTIFTNMLPALDLASQLVWDVNSNSMILTTRADMIKAIMQLISVLDETGFQQAVELFKLEHAPAKEIVELFKSIFAGGSDAAKKPNGFVNLASGARAKYFSDNVRVKTNGNLTQ